MPADWTAFSWHVPPALWQERPDGVLEVVTARGSDYWRRTQYGFVRDDGHAFLRSAPHEFTAQVTVEADYRHLYDQAGLMLRADAEHWLKVGVEYVGRPQWSAVLTLERSDWSVQAAEPHRAVTFRCIRRGDALLLHARGDTQSGWTLLRVAPFPPELDASVGLYASTPERAGLRARFRDFRLTEADPRPLHELTAD